LKSVNLTVTGSGGTDSEVRTDYIQVSTTQSGECYGADTCNPTGNPIGGGAGYTDIISQTNPNVKYVVTTKDQFLTALRSAKSGEIIFVPNTANIDMSGVWSTTIPAGVTLASDRGYNGSAGGRIFDYNTNNPGGWGTSISMLVVNGNNVRITGLRLEGSETSKVYSGYEGTFGIYSGGHTGVEIDNNELSGWGQAAITEWMGNDAGSNTTQKAALATPEIGSGIMYVHHNYIHHCQIEAEGYGVNVVRGSVLIKANLFDYCRHAIAADGGEWEGYEATYNKYLTHAYSHIFDVHGTDLGGNYKDGGYAGNTYRINHNTILSNTSHAIDIRGVPRTLVTITYNDINNCYGSLCWGAAPNAVQQYNTVGNISMFNNNIDGIYVAGSQIYKEVP
jgi:PKD repeat protein